MELVDYLFGTLPKTYCSLFFYISVIAFVQLFVLVASYVFTIIKDNKISSSPMFHIGGFLMMMSYVIIYIQNRLLHSMCLRSL